MVLLEICVDSVESIENAVLGGADRIELCSSLSEGGLTPSLGLFYAAKNIVEKKPTKIFAMIRIRGGNFTYSSSEISAMIEDVKYFDKNGADGIVFGALTENLQIDVDACTKILNAWNKEKPATFHRAFDETNPDDLPKNIKIVEKLGFSRILTSGFEATAEAGMENIKKMVANSEKLTIMPGSGVKKDNVVMIVRNTNCKEIHGSARIGRDIATKVSVGGNIFYVCSRKNVEEIVENLKQI